MTKNKSATPPIGKIFLGVFVVVFLLLFLVPTGSSSAAAGDCTANVQFEGLQSPVPFNQPMTLRAAITLGGFINGGADDGYCRRSVAAFSFVYKTIYIYYDFGSGPNLSRVPPAPIMGNNFRLLTIPFPQNVPTMYSSVSVNPSEYGFKDGDILGAKVHVLACGSFLGQDVCDILTTSSTQNIKLNAGVFNNFACVGKNSQGQDVYICDKNNASSCENTTGCTSKQPCIRLSDSKMCVPPNNLVPPSTHKECSNKVCAVVPGEGKDTCTTSPDNCASGGGGTTGDGGTTTTKYTFNLLNPIGVENFQDLVNIIGKWIFNLAIPIAVIVIIYAGVLMLTAGGVPARFQKGAKALWYAVLGLGIVLIGKGFVTLVQSILSLKK